MTKILLSSRAFSNQRIISAFSFLFNSNSVDYAVLIVNSTKERKKSPRIIELQHEIKNLGLNVKLFDVLKDNPAVLEQAKAIIFNGGYEFLLLHDLKKANLINKIRLLITANIPVYGISAGAMVLGPDLNLFDKLYPEDNFYHMTDCSALNVTAVRVYPHYDKQLKNDPTLEQKLINWEINTQQQITRLKDDQGILINDRNITLLNS